MKKFKCPFPLEVDAYQLGHFSLIPPGMNNGQVSQMTFRKGLVQNDRRIISAGLLPFVKLELENLIVTEEAVLETEEFINDFHADLKPPFARPYPFPKDMFMKVAKEYDGVLPVVVTGLPDGTAHYVGEPCVQIWTNVPGMGELVGWLESTLLPYMWTMSTVATKGRLRKDKFIKFYKDTHPDMNEQDMLTTISYKFHDFGRRGAACSQLSGLAHLMNFLGTDTMDAAYTAVHQFNNGKKFGASSIMAAAHRTISPWHTEDAAYNHQIPQYADTLQSVVADTYNYENGAEKIASFSKIVQEKNGLLVLRPDSGDPVECVIIGLKILDKQFGHTIQNGLKVLKNAAIIQGDGIDDENIFGSDGILKAALEMGYSPLNIAFGMGEKNHVAQRSMMEAGYKTSYVKDSEDNWCATMKGSNSPFKMSFPCPVDINVDNKSSDRVVRLSAEDMEKNNLKGYKVFYDGRPDFPNENNDDVFVQDTFEDIRERTYSSWNELSPLTPCDTISSEIRDLQKKYLENK